MGAGLTATARAALRRPRGFAHVLSRVEIELLLALGTAEEIRLPLVVGSSSGGRRVYVHAAHEIFHSCCRRHWHLSFIRESGRPVASTAGHAFEGLQEQRWSTIGRASRSFHFTPAAFRCLFPSAQTAEAGWAHIHIRSGGDNQPARMTRPMRGCAVCDGRLRSSSAATGHRHRCHIRQFGRHDPRTDVEADQRSPTFVGKA